MKTPYDGCGPHFLSGQLGTPERARRIAALPESARAPQPWFGPNPHIMEIDRQLQAEAIAKQKKKWEAKYGFTDE